MPRRAPAIPRHRQLISNPAASAWVQRTLGDSYETMQESVPPGYLPRLTDVMTDGSALVGRADTYGCGTYGCVYPTLTPDVVLKVTSDDTEAEFAKLYANTLVAPICVAYQVVMELDRKYRGSSIYLLWRESADHVGKIEEVLGVEAANLVNDQWDAAQPVFQNLHKKVPYEWELQEWLSSCANLRDSPYPALQHLGAGLLQVWEAQRIFFGDIHTGNLGCVHRPDGDRWVITDPGHIAVITDERPALPKQNPSRRAPRRNGEGGATKPMLPLRSDQLDMESREFDGIRWYRVVWFDPTDPSGGRGLASTWCYTNGEAITQINDLAEGLVTPADLAGRLQPDQITYRFHEVDGVRWAAADARGQSSGWCKGIYDRTPSSKLIRIPPLERLVLWFDGKEISEAPTGQLSVPQMEALLAALTGGWMKRQWGSGVIADVREAMASGLNTDAWLRITNHLMEENGLLYKEARISSVPGGPYIRRVT